MRFVPEGLLRPNSLDRWADSGSFRAPGAPICTTMARSPFRAARFAMTPLTVVFPTPPLPVTMSTLACEKNVNGLKPAPLERRSRDRRRLARNRAVTGALALRP